MKTRNSDLVAMGFLIAAVVGFLSFLTLDLLSDGSMRGWQLFVLIYESGKSGHLDAGSYLLTAGLSLGSLLTVSSPFLMVLVSRARILWWAIVVFSGMAMVGVAGYLGYILFDEMPEYSMDHYDHGIWCLMAYPVLNLCGLLWIQGRRPARNPSENPAPGP